MLLTCRIREMLALWQMQAQTWLAALRQQRDCHWNKTLHQLELCGGLSWTVEAHIWQPSSGLWNWTSQTSPASSCIWARAKRRRRVQVSICKKQTKSEYESVKWGILISIFGVVVNKKWKWILRNYRVYTIAKKLIFLLFQISTKKTEVLPA